MFSLSDGDNHKPISLSVHVCACMWENKKRQEKGMEKKREESNEGGTKKGKQIERKERQRNKTSKLRRKIENVRKRE